MNKTELREVCTEFLVPMRDKPKKFNGDIPWCRIEDIEGRFFNRSIIGLGVDEETVNKMNLTVFPPNTVICSCSATLGAYAINTKPLITNQTFIGLVCDEKKLDYRYLYYRMKLMTPALKNKSIGSTIPYIPRETFEKIEIDLPDLTKQNKIADILWKIDSKIENNNHINSKLESIAKTIYDYWFLQFEFPNEEGKPYKSSGGKMVWNDELKREIPEGWNMCDIQDCCEIIDCLHSKKPEYKYDNENSYLLTLDNLTPDGNIDISKKYYISNRDFLKWTSKITVSENDFVVTNAGRAGDVCKIPAGVKCAIGRNITAIHPVEINPYYLRQYFKSGYFSQQVKKNLDCGSFFKSFNVKSIKVLKILMPKGSIYDTYIDIITPIIQAIELKIQENQELASLRDFLLPMLMNGQITFKDN